MSVSREHVLSAVRRLCPPRFALEGDKTGLQVGSTRGQVQRVLCCLDLTREVADEAVRRRAELVISHHAVIFFGLKHLRTDNNTRGEILQTLLQHDITVYVPHTAMDVTPGGINDHLAGRVGLQRTRPLKVTGADATVLLQVDSVPDDVEALRGALLEKGATQVRLMNGRLEVLVPAPRAGSVSRAMARVVGEPESIELGAPSAARGIGRIGTLPKPETVRALALRLKESLGAPGARVTARDLDAEVRKVAVLAGNGCSFIKDAIFQGADALITGDVDHHNALEALARGLVLIDLTHHGCEWPVVELLVEGLRRDLDGDDVEVLASEVSTQPFTCL